MDSVRVLCNGALFAGLRYLHEDAIDAPIKHTQLTSAKGTSGTYVLDGKWLIRWYMDLTLV